MHIHILGICGAFMGGLATLAQALGHTVTGCDAQVYPPMSTQLTEQGIALIEGYGIDQLDRVPLPDLFIIGNVIKRGNPLMEAILNRGLPYISGPQWLGEQILADKWVIAVAGTHGKTTTAAMLAWLLEETGFNPSFLIGGVPLNFGRSARLTDSHFFVIEADEYDTAFFDKRSKFVHYRPRTAVLNNLEYDHADIFPNLEAIETQFHHLIRTIPSSGRIISNGRNEALTRVLARGCWSEVEYFGVKDAWHTVTDTSVPSQEACKKRNEEIGESTQRQDTLMEQFSIKYQVHSMGTVCWSLQGEHNQLNALAALVAARHAGVFTTQSLEALSRFAGVKRRMEVRGCINGITLYDDFAHHPTAIQNTLAGLRTRVGKEARILAVFEPRSNTMKLGAMKTSLIESLHEADLIFGYQPKQDSHAKSWRLATALAPLGEPRARAFNTLKALIQALQSTARSGDHVLIMSNGGFGGIHEKLLTGWLAQN